MRCRLVLHGQVQAVGCRALAKRVADRMRFGGSVRNMSNGNVEIYIEVQAERQLEKFIDALKKETKNTAVRISKIETYKEEDAGYYGLGKPPVDFEGFRIEYV